MSLPMVPGPGEVVVEGAAVRSSRLVLLRSTEQAEGESDVLVALGMHTAAMVRLVARRHAWPLTRVAVRLRSGAGEPEDGVLDVILEGLLEDWQRRYLCGVAERHVRQAWPITLRGGNASGWR